MQSNVSCSPDTLRHRALRQVGVSWDLESVRGTLDSLCPLPLPDKVRQLCLLPPLLEPHSGISELRTRKAQHSQGQQTVGRRNE